MLIFKLCRSRKDGRRMRRKVESSEANIVRIGTERKKIFPSRQEKGTNGLSFFVGGENRVVDPNCMRRAQHEIPNLRILRKEA